RAIGQVLFLLLNGSIGATNAVRLPDNPRDRLVLDEAIGDVVGAFADALSPPSKERRRRRSHFSLYSGYALTEARRRLGNLLSIDQAGVYLSLGSEVHVIQRLATELVRRGGDSVSRAPHALEAMEQAYVHARPTLAAFY